MDEAGEDVENICPLCMEEMDVTDRHLKPCQCGYQICVWCWHQVIEVAARDNTEGRCPACRTPYDKAKVVGTRLSASELEFTVDKRKAHKSKKQDGRKHLSNVRVVQRNLVYIVGFPYNLADEELLEKREYFGQYGKILKVAVSKQNTHSGPSASVYVTFVREEDAVKCIKAVDGCIFEGKLLRACFGTNKYCNAWLKNMPCNNPECLYLHDEGPDEDSYTKEEMITNKSQFHDLTRPPHRAAGVLPPPFVEASSSVPLIAQPQQIVTPNKAPLQKSCSTPIAKVTNLPPAASWGTRASNAKPPTATKVPALSIKKKPGGVGGVDSLKADASEQEASATSEIDEYGFLRDLEHKADIQTELSQGSSSPENHGYVSASAAELIRPPSGYDEGPSNDGQVLNVGDVSINLNCEIGMMRSEPTSPQTAGQSPTPSEDLLSALEKIDLSRDSRCDAGSSGQARTVEPAESNIIEDILAMEFNPDEGFDHLTKLLRQRPGRQFEENLLPLKPKQQSRFSFARQGAASGSNQNAASFSDESFPSRDTLTRSLSLQSSSSDGHLKSRLFAPPGFAGTSVPPPGFSVRNATSVPQSPAGNRLQEFDLIDPAIMAVGRHELARSLRPVQTKADARQLHESDALLGLELMQQQQQQQQQQAGFMDFGNLIKHQLPHQQARKLPLKYPMDDFASILHSDVGSLTRLSGQYDNNYVSPYSPGSARSYRSLENGWAGYGGDSLGKYKRGLGGSAITNSLRPGDGSMFFSNGNQSLSGLEHYMNEADIQGAFV